MSRSTNAVASRRRRKKVLDLAKGYRGARSKTYRASLQQVMKSHQYAYRDRRTRRRNMRRLWIMRINAAARANGTNYASLINALAKADIQLDRHQLSELAIHDASGFSKLVEQATANA